MEETQQEQALKAMLEQNKVQEEQVKPEGQEVTEKTQEASQADEVQTQAEASRQDTRRTYTYADRNAGVRDFVEAAESVPEEKLGDLARHRRSMNADLTEEDLLTGDAESLEYFKFAGQDVPMLKLRLKKSGLPVYVPQNVAGANFSHMETFIGHSYSVAITDFVNVNEGEVNAAYIILASIQQAEFVVKGELYRDLASTNNAIHEQAVQEKREGVVTGLIRLNNVGGNGQRVPEINHWLVFFEYKGVQFSIPARNYAYLSTIKPVQDQIQIGDHFYFRATEAAKKDFRTDNSAAKRAVESGREALAPKGIYYDVNATALPFRANPDDDLRVKLNHGTVFLAHVAAYNSIRGLLVEVAPGWVIKGFMGPRFSGINLGDLDVADHTAVTVRLNRLDFRHHVGQCEVVAFPQGTKGSTF